MKTIESPLATSVSAPSLDELGAQIIALSGRFAAAACRWLLLVAEFDAREGCAQFGLGSTAQWLEYSCGIARRTAVEHLRIARALAGCPRLVEEMSGGRLSYSHVRAISRIADAGTDKLVDDLINLAENGTVEQLESTVRGLRTVRDSDRPGGALQEYVTHSWTNDSQWRMSARLDPERGALVEAAVAAVAKSEGLSTADALVRLAEIGVAALADGGQPRALRGDEHAAVVVQLDASRYEADDSDATMQPDSEARSAERGRRPFARIDGGPGLPDDVVERLLCAGRVRTVLRAGRGPNADILDLGRSHRLVTERQFRALLLRDGECAHPGCTGKRALEAHHVRHWLRGGRTDLANLVLLCRRHHHGHHDGEFVIIARGGGRFDFLRADGREIPTHIDPSELITDRTAIEQEHPTVAATAATPNWDGSLLDHDLAVWGIAQGLPGHDPRTRSAERADTAA